MVTFHCELLKGAGEKLGQALEAVELQPFSIPYVTNVTAGYVTEPDSVKELLVRQVFSSVRWQQCVEAMIRDGVDTFVEIGPRKNTYRFPEKNRQKCESSSCGKGRGSGNGQKGVSVNAGK